MKEKIIETKICNKCSTDFPIYQKDKNFYNNISPKIGTEMFEIPSPKLCPDCRAQRRLAWRNDRKLYKRRCDATGKEIISVFSPDKKYIVYDAEFYWSDRCTIDMSETGYDFSKPFFEQFAELHASVPKRALLKGTGSINCAYASLVGGSKDGYLIFNGINSSNCLYTDGMSDVESCVDCSQIRNSSYCYECIDVINCNNCCYIQDCQNCSNSEYLFDCMNCHDCFACVGLRNASYCIHNTQYTKEEYEIKKSELIKSGFQYNDFYAFSLQYPRLHMKTTGSENISGDMIYNSKDIHKSYEVYDAQNVRYSVNIYKGAHDCMDVNVGLNNGHKLYEVSLSNKSCHNILFSHDCWNMCENLMYCSECKKTKDCFGCCGLIGKQYCILNKQYTKQEYEELLPKIIGHMQTSGDWGEFFPASLSPFGYNESVAQEFYPLNEQEAQDIGANWTHYQADFPKAEKIISANRLPVNIAEIPDDILAWAIECEVSKKPFRIIKQELDFYRKHNISIPKRHPDQRYMDRLELRTPRKSYNRNCFKCETQITTSYHPSRPERIYCETCYNKEIY